ncbi:MAG: metal-sensitive transcriptional regulator [Rhizomicrobium sp.]
MKHDSKLLTHLRRIEGQVRGVARMVEEERYCIDILNQTMAIKAALGRVEQEVLKDHAAHCIRQAVESGDAKNQAKKFAELVELISRGK